MWSITRISIYSIAFSRNRTNRYLEYSPGVAAVPGNGQKKEEMTPPFFLLILSAEHLPGNSEETGKECGLPECPAKGPSPANTASLFPF